MTVTAIRPADVGVEVGTVFMRSWGYDQTNVDFYRVVGLTPKGVRLQQWSSKTVHDSGSGPVTHVVPGDDPRQVTVWPTATQDDLAACELCRVFTEANYPGGYYYPARDCDAHGPRTEDAPVQTKRLSSYGGDSVYVAVGHYNDHAYRWDGTPAYETASGWGH